MDREVRDFVRRRAGNRCEYCRLPQEAERLFHFHVEHIVARKHRGLDEPDNLALACHHCNLHKGPNLAGLDSEGGAIALLFNPRRDAWHDNFQFRAGEVAGLTPIGRATVQVLQFNSPNRVKLREEWLKERENG
jgi:hypothetical protein